MDEGVHVAGFLGRHVVLDIEALDLAGKRQAEGRGVELGDRRTDARAARQQVGPALGDRVADRADQPEAGDDDRSCAASSRCQAFWWLTA
jgi:hypothetical protein